eukprot:Skav210657  [mRNA]  locus=scaffold2527:223834:227220:+ [translate_table: standard]
MQRWYMFLLPQLIAYEEPFETPRGAVTGDATSFGRYPVSLAEAQALQEQRKTSKGIGLGSRQHVVVSRHEPQGVASAFTSRSVR